MVGDLAVQFVIYGPRGNTLTLTREEAERLLAALKRALKATGKGNAVIAYTATGNR